MLLDQQDRPAGALLRDLAKKLWARCERLLILWAHGPWRRQGPVDDVAAHVVIGAGARVEEGGVSVAVHREQARVSELMGHSDRALVRRFRVEEVPDHQHGVGRGSIPRSDIAIGGDSRPAGTGLVKRPYPGRTDISRPARIVTDAG